MKQGSLGVLACAASLGAALVSVPASAHHGLTIFDREKEVTVRGVIKDFQWTNPHSWLFVLTNVGGQVHEATFEGDPPAILSRRGWRADTFKPGDEVIVVAHPWSNGSPGGMFVSIERTGATPAAKASVKAP